MPTALLRTLLDELLDDLEVDISLKERQADLAQGILDVLLGHHPLAAELLEDRFKFFGKAIKHRRLHRFVAQNILIPLDGTVPE